jgi:DNA polymerase II small subunit
MREAIVEFLSDRGTLVQPEALEYLASLSDPVERLQEGLRAGHEVPFVLTLDHARRLTDRGDGTAPEPKKLPDEGPGAGETATAPGGTEAAVAVAGEPEPPEPEPPEPPPEATDGADPTDGDELTGRPSTGPSTNGGSEPDRSSPTAGPAAGTAGSTSTQMQAVADEVKVELDITGESTCEGTIEDFTKLFRDRYNRIRRLFRSRREMVGAVSIADLDPGDDRKVIGLVKDVKTTKNGHRILELEDDTGETVVLAPEEEDRLIELADTILEDEVVGIVGKKLPDRGNKDGLLVMEELVRVDLRLDRDRPEGLPGSAVFVSDVHLGADTFLADAWDDFVDWLAERAGEPGEGGVRYLVVAGDLVEGVGVYPGQEDILRVPDVYDQYEHAASTLERLPDDLQVLVQPGNHDTVVRLAEPQPALPEAVREMFPDNVRFVGNPCRVSFNDVTLLTYHGVSLFDYFEALPPCNIDRPVQTMEEILRRRHLCPPYGGATPLAPEHRDHLVVDEEPDIFVTGHVHAAQTGEYRGTRLINASTWQEQTDYQRMRGFDPDPCKAFEVDLSTLGLTTWAFDAHEGTGAVEPEQVNVSRTKVGAMES